MPDIDLPLPFEAYVGEKPYIFVSYAHKDGNHVFPEIRSLHERGYRIWYDEGIDPGNEWPEEVAKALAGATLFLVFISLAAVQSQNVRNEINFALNRQKSFLAVYLEDTQLPPGLELRMGDIQAIMKWRMTDDRYQQKITKSFPLELCELLDDEKPASQLEQKAAARPPYSIAWSTLLRGAQYSPIRALLPMGREILCLSSKSPDTWVYALHSHDGKLIWQVQGGNSPQHLELIGWSQDYLYLTGDIEGEPDLRFVQKFWLREGDKMAGLSWYEVAGHARQKYDAVPEWDTVSWMAVSKLESEGLTASATDTMANVVDGKLRIERLAGHEINIWEPPSGDSITSVGVARGSRVVVALASGHVCLLEETT